MGLLKLCIIGLLIGIGGYYLRIYMKGVMCPLTVRVDGKDVLITGANSGIGLATAIELASRGAIVHMACRDKYRCETARTEVLKRSMVDQHFVVTHALDLASITSILEFVQEFRATVRKLDILINNAGIMMCPYGVTENGFEMQMGVNHFGHFLLTRELLDLIKVGVSPRIVIVSSLAHEFGTIDIDELNRREEKYGASAAYSESKLANVLHAKALSRRLRQSGIAVVSLHPGTVATDLQREWHPLIQSVLSAFQFLLVKTPTEGAQTSICCAVDPNLILYTGNYFNDCKPSWSMNGQANNETLAELLWQKSDQIINNAITKLQ